MCSINNEEQGKKITIIDSPMGFGKTSYIIDKMKNDLSHKYLYITPFLSEVERIKTECKNREFVEPDNRNRKGSKLESLKQLVVSGRNIASTHSLLSMADEELIMLIKSNNYILVLDEALSVVEDADVTESDIELLFNQDLIEISDKETGLVKWKDDTYNGLYNDIRDLAKANTLFYVSNTLMIWALPIDIFKVFDSAYILSYLFDCQVQKYYFDYFKVEYEYYHVEGTYGNYKLIKTVDSNYDIEFRRKAKELINIVDNEKLNTVGDKNYSMSMKWFSKSENELKVKQLKKNIYNFFRNISKTPSNKNMWTCYKKYQSKVKGSGYSKGFVSCNSRATNEFSDKEALAYCINRYMNPFYKKFFSSRGIHVNENKYALSELLQWIWRSQIRNGQPIDLYIPSKRMRTLLTKFLNNDNDFSRIE